jgi:hypothetical protein
MAACACHADTPATSPRWKITRPGQAISWNVAAEDRPPHKDFIELGGKKCTAILFYSIDDAKVLDLKRALIWPSLRIHPNNTYGNLKVDFHRSTPPRAEGLLPDAGLDCFEPIIQIDQRPITPVVREVRFANGLLTFISDLGNNLVLHQTCTPSVDSPCYIEQWQVSAETATVSCKVEITPISYLASQPYDYVDKGIYHYGQPVPIPANRRGHYQISINSSGAAAKVVKGARGAVCTANVIYRAGPQEEPPVQSVHPEQELAKRATLSESLAHDLEFECPDPVIQTLFNFSKLRASDSICQTRNGPLHAPGGGCYYAAIWANDTVEYVGPFFPLLGYSYANQATLNALDHYSRYLNREYDPLPSSIIAEGTDIWARRIKPNGLPDAQGDCGDAAMLAYGAPRFLLALGDRSAAHKYWPLIEWSLEYCDRRKTTNGVIESASDELEGRFSSGNCNLNTSMLTYGGLLASADLADALGKTTLGRTYRMRAQDLRRAAAKYFEADIAGFSTYQYHQGCKELRAWICMPLTMGILDRSKGTVAALFSDRLWTENGLLTADNSTTYWDRSGLSALRAAFVAGETDLALSHLRQLSENRLLGEHVPFVIEAYPEGNGRHLSGESALYCRVITEGLFGFAPRGFRSFNLHPHLPSTWNKVALRRVRAFQSCFDIEISRKGTARLNIRILPENGKQLEYSVNEEEAVMVKLD